MQMMQKRLLGSLFDKCSKKHHRSSLLNKLPGARRRLDFESCAAFKQEVPTRRKSIQMDTILHRLSYGKMRWVHDSLTGPLKGSIAIFFWQNDHSWKLMILAIKLLILNRMQLFQTEAFLERVLVLCRISSEAF